LQEALNAAQQDAAATLARVQTAARAARDSYVEEINQRNGQLETARKFLDEWNELSRKRDNLFKEAKALKDRGQLTEAQRSRIAAAWAPVRARRDQFIARDYTGEKLTKIISQAIPARKRDAQSELVTRLRAAREGLKPFDCAEFPEAQKYLATLTKSINYHDKEPATPNSGHSTVGFMAIPDLVLPGADAERKPPIIAAAPKPAPNPAPSATPNERTFNVSAGKWHSTGITLKKGQSFDVKAS
jgi:hypothetical protein